MDFSLDILVFSDTSWRVFTNKMNHLMKILYFILSRTQDEYLYEILNDFEIAWALMMNDIDQILESSYSVGQYSQEANDTFRTLNDPTDHVNNVIMNF